MADAVEATASLKLLLEGIQEVLSGLQQVEDKIRAIQSMSGSVGIMGGGSSNPQATGGVPQSASVNPGGFAGFNTPAAVGTTSAPTAMSGQIAPPTAQGTMPSASIASWDGRVNVNPSGGYNSRVYSAGGNSFNQPFIDDSQWLGTGGPTNPEMIASTVQAIRFQSASQAAQAKIERDWMKSIPPVTSDQGFDPFDFDPGSRSRIPSYSGGGNARVNYASSDDDLLGGVVQSIQFQTASQVYKQKMDAQTGLKPGGGSGRGVSSFQSRIGMYMAIREGIQAAQEQENVYSATIAGGAPWDAENLYPSSLALGTTTAGAVIGSFIPGVGSAVGAMGGAIVGKIADTMMRPYVDRDVAQHFLNRSYAATGQSIPGETSLDMLNFAQSQMQKGLGIAPEMVNRLKAGVNPRSAADETTDLASRIGGAAVGGLAGFAAGAAFTPIGAVVGGIAGAVGGWEMASTIQNNTHLEQKHEGLFRDDTNPATISSFVDLMANPTVQGAIGPYRGTKNYSPDELIRATRIGISQDPKGMQDVIAHYSTGDGKVTPASLGKEISGPWGTTIPPEYEPNTPYSRSSGLTKEQASMLESERKESFDAQSQAKLLADLSDPGLVYAISAAKTKSAAAVRAAWTGQDANEHLESLRLKASDAEKHGDTPNQLKYEAEIKQFDLDRDVAIYEAERDEKASILDKKWSYALGTSKYQAVSGPVNQSGIYDTTLASAARDRAEYYRSEAYGPANKGQRAELSAKADKEEADALVYDFNALTKNTQGQYAMAMTGLQEQSVDPRITLIYGYGVKKTGAARDALASQADLAVAAAQEQVDAYSDKPDSAPSIAARNALASAKIMSAQAQVDRAISPMGGFSQARLSTLGAEETALREGLIPGAPGMIRQNIKEQMDIQRQYIKDLDERKKNLESEGPLKPEQAKILAAERAGAVNQLSGLTKEFNFGFMDRLMSIAANMPQEKAWLAHAMFSNREASQAGVLHPSIGGTQEQMHQMQAMGYDLRSIAGANPQGGSAAGFSREAQGAAGSSQPVSILITIKDERGNVLSKNAGVVENFKTGQTSAFRAGLSTRIYS